MVVLSTWVSYTTQLSGSTFHLGELNSITEWWCFHSRELYNTTELTHELPDVCNIVTGEEKIIYVLQQVPRGTFYYVYEIVVS